MRYVKTIGTGEAISILKAENAELLDRIERLEECAKMVKVYGLMPDQWYKDVSPAEKAMGMNYLADLIEGKRT